MIVFILTLFKTIKICHFSLMSFSFESIDSKVDVHQLVEDHSLIEDHSIIDVCKMLKSTELSIDEGINVLTDCKNKYKSADSFKIFQYTNVLFGEDYGKILDLLGLVCKVLKSPIIKSTYYTIESLIGVLNERDEEIKRLNKQIDELKFSNSRQFDDIISMRQALESKNAENKKKDNLTENISKKLSEMELSIAQKDETIQSLKRTVQSQSSEIKIREDTIKKLSSQENLAKEDKEQQSPKYTEADDQEFEKIYAILEKGSKDNSEDTLKFFVDNGYHNMINHNGDNMILHAAWNNNFPLAKHLIEAGGDPNSPNKSNHTMLALFCGHGNLEAVKYLTNIKSVNINSQNIEGDTPLHYATFHSELPVIEYLCSLPGIIINIKDTFGKTPLSWAKTDAIKRFLRSKGAVM